MDNRETNRFSMYSSVLAILESFQPVVSQIEILNECYNNFKTRMQSLKDKDRAYLDTRKGRVIDKEQARNDLIECLAPKVYILNVIAKRHNDGNLLVITQTSRSGLRRLRESRLLQAARTLYEHYALHIDELVKNGADPTTVKELEEKINTYTNAISVKQIKHAESKASRQELKVIFKEIDTILKDMDKCFEMVKTKDVNCYNQYKAARVIRDHGASHSAKTGNPSPNTW